MLQTACDRIEQFCKDHLPVVNKQRIIPKLRHQDTMAIMVMEPMEDTSSTDDENELRDEFTPPSQNGSYITSQFVKPPRPGVPRIRRATEMRLTSMSAK